MNCPAPMLVIFITLAGFVLFFAIFALSWIIRFIWSWIDEAEMVSCPLILFGGLLNGLRTYGFSHFYSSKEEAEGFGRGMDPSGLFGVLVLQSLLLSLAVGITVVYPLAAAVIGVLIALAFLTRFTRRLAKAYQSHTEDKNAHR